MDIVPSKKKKKTRPSHQLNSSDESNDEFMQAVSCPTAEKGFWKFPEEESSRFSAVMNEPSSPLKGKKKHIFKTFVLGVAGGVASGKTTVCDMVKKNLHRHRMSVIEMNWFYKPLNSQAMENLNEYNFDHPDAYDWEMLQAQMELLLRGKTASLPQWDAKTKTRLVEPLMVSGAMIDIIILEGNLTLYHPAIRNMMDLKIFVDTDSDTRLSRQVKRDVVHGNEALDVLLVRFEKFTKLAFDMYIQPSKKHADVVIPRGPSNEIAIGLLIQHVSHKLEVMNKHKTLKF
jgi:uridine kinase